MMLRRFSRKLRDHDWPAVLIEVLVVAVGLLMALQVDRWRDEAEDRQLEREYVDRLLSAVREDLPRIHRALELAEVRLELVDLLMEVSEDPSVAAREPLVFMSAVHQGAFTYSPRLTVHTFEDLRSTGNMALIRNQALINELHDYYDYDQTHWQYRPLDFAVESRHFELAAGVLTHEQARYLQDNWGYLGRAELEEARKTELPAAPVIEAGRRLASKPALVEWLPQIRSMQMEQRWTNQRRLERARATLEALERYRAEI